MNNINTVQSMLPHSAASGDMRNHSPHRTVRPGTDLFEPRIFLRDFPHRVVNFLPWEMCVGLHDIRRRRRKVLAARLSFTCSSVKAKQRCLGSVLFKRVLPRKIFKIRVLLVWKLSPSGKKPTEELIILVKIEVNITSMYIVWMTYYLK